MIRHFWLPKLIALAIALSFVLTLSGVGIATTYAASHTHTLSQSTTPKSTHPLDCSFNLSSSPTSLAAQVNTEITIFVYVYCPPGQANIIMDWRDGSTDSWSCGNLLGGCSNGDSYNFTHTYTRTGSFIAKAYYANNSSIAVWITCNIHS